MYDRVTGLPDPETTCYSAIFRRSRNGSVATMENELRAIGLGLEWAHQQGIDFEQRIGSLDLLTPEEVLALRDAMRASRRAGNPTVDAGVHYSRCTYFRDYVSWRAESVIARIRMGDGSLEARLKLQAFEKCVTKLLTKPTPNGREGLTPEAEARLREVILPGHSDNPFQPQHQARNHALLLLYLDLPLRLSEPLNIKGNDLQLNGERPLVTIHRRADDSDDPRGRQPLTKTAARILPLGEALRGALREWVVNHRSDKERFPGAKKTPYIFVSRLGLPIGKSTVGDMFRTLRTVRGLPSTLGAHVLRHTWNDRFSEQADTTGMPEATEEKIRSYMNGWKDGSKMAAVYTRRHTRAAAERASLKLQKASTEGRNR